MSDMAEGLAAATTAVEQHLMLYMLPANYALNREYNQDVTDANAGTIAAKVIEALTTAGFGPVREQAATIAAVRDLANSAGRCGWRISADDIRKTLGKP